MGSANNYCTNPSFEANMANWTPAAGTTQSRDLLVTAPGADSYSMKLVSDGSAAMRVTHTGLTSLVIGQMYSYSAFVYVPAASTFSVYLGINGAENVSQSSGGIRGRWTRLFVSFVANAVNHNVTVRSASVNASGDTFYVDRVKVTDGGESGPYFDGSYPLANWTGANNNSPSQLSLLNAVPTTTSEMLVLGTTCMNSLAWNISTRGGRLNIPQKRGANTIVPTRSGSIFAANRPYDFNPFTLSMWVLGVLPDGTIPRFYDQRRVWENNIATILGAAASDYEPVTAYSWQSDGTVRTATLDLNSATNVSTMMGGTRGEFTLSFDVLDGWWSDWFSAKVVGTPGAGWSNQTLSLPQLAGSTAPIEDAIVTVNGLAQSPRVTSASGVWTQYNQNLSATNKWIIDSGAYSSTVDGVSSQTTLTRSGNHPRYISIPVKNGMVPSLTMTATGTGATTNLSVTARRKHWGA